MKDFIVMILIALLFAMVIPLAIGFTYDVLTHGTVIKTTCEERK